MPTPGKPSENVANSILVDAGRLESFYFEAFSSVGVPEKGARVIANALVEADLRGINSHGSMLMPDYIGHIRAGGINPAPQVKVVRELPGSALLDGDNGMGHWIAAQAMDLAIEKAHVVGACAVSVRNSNHFGVAAYYVSKGVAAGMIAFATTGSNALMAPWGGITPLLGNGPVCFGIPAGEELPIIHDMATSAVAKAKIWLMARQGVKEIPAGWAMTRDGQPTQDPEAALAGILLPTGGVKGYGLSVAMESLSAVMSGSTLPAQVPKWSDQSAKQCLGHFFAVYSVDAFMPLQEFTAGMDSFIRSLKSSEKLPHIDEILLPGEPEFLMHQNRLREGIPLAPMITERLEALAAELELRHVLPW